MTLPNDPSVRKPDWLHPILRSRFFWLLAALVAFIIISGEIINTDLGLWSSFVCVILIFLAVTYATRSTLRRRLLMASLIAVLAAAWIAGHLHPNAALGYIWHTVLLVCLVVSVLWTLQFVLTSGSVGADHILGAICTYILIAMIFATIYAVQLRLDPNAFKGLDPAGGHPLDEFLYFSFTTLSTVGYGDIVPATSRARSVCMTEQLTGTFYLAILIARLASLYGPPAAAKPPSDKS